MRLFGFIAWSFLIWSSTLFGEKWEYVHTEEGVKVYKKDVKNSDLIAVKGVTVLPFPRAQVLSLMIDHTKRHLWVDRLLGIDRIKIFDGKLDAISYYKVDLPWPVSDRDFVVRTKIWYDPAEDVIHSKTASVEGVYPEQEDFVRAHSHQSTVTLKEAGPSSTAVEVIARVDPKGSLPLWLVNYLQAQWAHVTLTSLKEALAEFPIAVDPVYHKLVNTSKSSKTTK